MSAGVLIKLSRAMRPLASRLAGGSRMVVTPGHRSCGESAPSPDGARNSTEAAHDNRSDTRSTAHARLADMPRGRHRAGWKDGSAETLQPGRLDQSGAPFREPGGRKLSHVSKPIPAQIRQYMYILYKGVKVSLYPIY
jgi:hypothetical protein